MTTKLSSSAWKHIVFLWIAVILAALRIGGITHESFQAVAHIYVGVIFTLAYLQRDKWYLWIGIVVSIIELCVAIYQRM